MREDGGIHYFSPAQSWSNVFHRLRDFGGVEPGGFFHDPSGPQFDGVTATVPAYNAAVVDGVLSGVRWNQSSITFSFPDEATDYENPYDGNAPSEAFGQLSASHQAILRAALDGNTWRSVDGFTLLQTDDNGTSGDSTLRAAYSTNAGGSAYAYYPTAAYPGGDMWFGPTNNYNYPTATLGSSAYRSTLHELGHALGLKHGHEVGGPGKVALPVEYNHHEFTVMPYISYQGGTPTGYTNAVGSFPQSFMMVDIFALQYMYGANFEGTSSTYTWSPTTGEMSINAVGQGAPNNGVGGAAYNKIFLTIWDNGGVYDVYDLSNYTTNLTLDLRPGQSSVFSADQLANLGGGPNGGFARGNVYNAFMYNNDTRSLIEAARGGGGNDTITGNQIGNSLIGNDGNDELRGGYGNDTLSGGYGDDKLYGEGEDDTIFADFGSGAGDLADGGDGIDTVVISATAVDNFAFIIDLGKRIDNFNNQYVGIENLVGGSNNDILIGTIESRLFAGSGGDDTYRVYSAETLVREYAGSGNDRIYSAVSYGLETNSEVEILSTNGSTSTRAINLTGNALAQQIIGNAGVNILSSGGSGAADTLRGLGGNDTYRVYNSGDVIAEGTGQGTADRVMAAVTYALGTGVQVELLTTNGSTSTSARNLVGNEFAQTIIGNAGANRIAGQGGADTLTGLGGKDTFIFATAVTAANGNVDIITDFNVFDDTIQLKKSVFAATGNPGELSAAAFSSSQAGLAGDASDRIIYETDSGKLFYDADGADSTVAMHFATIAAGLALTHADFVVA